MLSWWKEKAGNKWKRVSSCFFFLNTDKQHSGPHSHQRVELIKNFFFLCSFQWIIYPLLWIHFLWLKKQMALRWKVKPGSSATKVNAWSIFFTHYIKLSDGETVKSLHSGKLDITLDHDICLSTTVHILSSGKNDHITQLINPVTYKHR